MMYLYGLQADLQWVCTYLWRLKGPSQALDQLLDFESCRDRQIGLAEVSIVDLSCTISLTVM